MFWGVCRPPCTTVPQWLSSTQETRRAPFTQKLQLLWLEPEVVHVELRDFHCLCTAVIATLCDICKVVSFTSHRRSLHI